MSSSITSSQVQRLLESLYADSAQNDPIIREVARKAIRPGATESDHFKAMRGVYMAVNRDFGNLLYTLARSSKAATIVEFGTSFGVSTIYLACAIRDNGAGKVITTEYEPSKADRARRNLAAASLEECVEFRVGDALQTLRSDWPEQVDLIFLDGAKSLYLDVLKILEPRLRPGGIVASDNTDREELKPFLDYLRIPANGYTSSALLSPGGREPRGHEISIRN